MTPMESAEVAPVSSNRLLSEEVSNSSDTVESTQVDFVLKQIWGRLRDGFSSG